MTVRPARISRGTILNGRFRLERLLGQGGMSAVWGARDLQLGCAVAVKLLGPEAVAKPPLRQRFVREAGITRRIRSPHVAQIVADGVTAAGVPFVAMELLKGESLAAHLAHVGRCSLVTAGAIVEQVCRALSSAHVAGLVHRDVKPANIFLTQQPSGELFVRVLDFGLAKEVLFGTSGLTQAGEILGTADYMSAEQLCSPDSVTSAADIWSLGVVLYELLTGKRPFDESTFPLLALRIAEGTFLPPSQVCPDLPKAVDAVIARALAPHPSQRYATAAELGNAFLRVVRSHSSDSVVRPDVMRVLQAHAERTQPDPDHYPAQDRVMPESVTPSGSSARELLLGIMLVAVCIATVATSWLAAETLDRTPPVTSGTAAQTHISAASMPPSAASTSTLPVAQATDLAPHNSPAPVSPTSEEPPLSAAGSAPPREVSTQFAGSSHPALITAPRAAQTQTQRSKPPKLEHSTKPAPATARKPPATPQKQQANVPPPTAATPPSQESKYGF